jgi:hypothetical protein
MNSRRKFRKFEKFTKFGRNSFSFFATHLGKVYHGKTDGAKLRHPFFHDIGILPSEIYLPKSPLKEPFI